MLRLAENLYPSSAAFKGFTPIMPQPVRPILFLLAGLLSLALAYGSNADEPPADIALILAVDSSSSVDESEFTLQMAGLAAAFRDAEVQTALSANAPNGAMILMMEWSSAGWQQVNIPWRRIRTAADADALARDMADAPRLIYGGGTAIGAALDFARRQFTELPMPVHRRVIDVSGDGSSNQGPALEISRKQAMVAGITVNGLAIINEELDLADYFRHTLIAGIGSFALPATDYTDFAKAIKTKLLREIAVPVAADPDEDGPNFRLRVKMS